MVLITTASLLVVVVFVLSTLRFLHAFCWNPSTITRKLQQQGLTVLPFRPIFGNALQIQHLQRQAEHSQLPSPTHHDILPHIMPFYTALRSKYGNRVVFWWGNLAKLYITNPDDVKEVLSTKFKHYRKAQWAFLILRRMFGDGLLLAEAGDWENQRRILGPAFFNEKLKAMVADMCRSATEMCNSWQEIVKEKAGAAEIDVAQGLKNVTADIISRTCFGSSYLKGKSVFETQVRLQHIILSDEVANSMVPGYRFLPTGSNLLCWKLEKKIERDLREIIEARKESVKKRDSISVKTDMLGLILTMNEQCGMLQESEKKGDAKLLTTQQVMDECKTFFFAGHDTTANLLAWTMMLLGLHTKWQEKCRTEVLEVCGKEETKSADQINRLKIVGMVLNEVLRLYPPVPELSSRVAAPDEKDLKVGELRVPAGLILGIPVAVIHRDRALWGEDADEFKPERFAEGVAKACKHPNGFLPFAMGPRTCIGQTFAIMEAKVVMASILQRFTFSVSPNYKHSPQRGITLKPQHGMQIILRLFSP